MASVDPHLGAHELRKLGIDISERSLAHRSGGATATHRRHGRHSCAMTLARLWPSTSSLSHDPVASAVRLSDPGAPARTRYSISVSPNIPPLNGRASR